MALAPGTRLSAYEITAPIGAGGMGEVYRARDTKLNRDVALKVLPDSFANDPDRLVRFTREAQTLASLSHPNIAAIYGLEESGGVSALVMELIEGDDLSQRIARGALPIDEALLMATQIAEALEAAHEQGIIHRDLKPANIKVRSDGTVKVLDFGLAKAMEPTRALSPSMSLSPTITTPAMTQAGVILGTAAYMAPEQAKGKTADKRADIWAFGCVFYEMLSGRPAFTGETVSETLADVLKSEPTWNALPASVPANVSTVIRRCLVKDPRHRIRDIGDVRLALEGAFETAAKGPAEAGHGGRVGWRRVALSSTVALLAGAVVATTLTWFATRPADLVPSRVSRLSLALQGTEALASNANTDRDLAITPDGSRLVYIGNTGQILSEVTSMRTIFVRSLDALKPVAVFTGTPRGLSVSPDGQWIGFVDGAAVLKKVAVTGGPAITVTTLDGVPRGIAWGSDDTMIVATTNVVTGLQRVTAGGPVTVLTRPDRAKGEIDHLHPELLPGGRAVLFTITTPDGFDAGQVAVLDLQTGVRKVLLHGGSHAHYVASGRTSPTHGEREGGHLVYAAASTLWAVPFDLATLETRGTPVPVVPDVMTKSSGVDAVVARDGTLAYVSWSGDSARALVWVDRSGREEPLDVQMPLGRHLDIRLSPDGKRIALATEEAGNTDVWVMDTVDGRRRRITVDRAVDRYPLWTPDGKALLFFSNRNGTSGVYRKMLDTDRTEEPLATDTTRVFVPWSWTADGQTVLTSDRETTGNSGYNVGAITLRGKPAWKSLLSSAFSEGQPVVSPDGKWMAYFSNEGGPGGEVFARSFPDVTAGLEQVSTSGGTNPNWTRGGRELVYRNGETIMAVPIELSPTFRAGPPEVLFTGSYFFNDLGTQWDVTRDGKRFLMLKPAVANNVAGGEPTRPQITIVLNWFEELRRLAPTK